MRTPAKKLAGAMGLALIMAALCIGASGASGHEAGATSSFKANTPPRAGFYSGTTHRGREFSLRVTADHHVTTFKLNDQPLWPHLRLAMYDDGHGYRFHWEHGRQEISGGVHAQDYLRGAFYLGQDHFEHFDVFWRHS